MSRACPTAARICKLQERLPLLLTTPHATRQPAATRTVGTAVGKSMLAERVSLVLPVFFTRDELSLSLLHQVISHQLRLLLSQRGFHVIVDEFLELWWQFAKHSSFINHASPPVPLLWRDVGRGRNFDVWVNKEKR